MISLQRLMRFFWFLFGLSATSFLGALGFVLIRLPEEKVQGIVQKIFFFHVPSAFAMYLFLILGAILSVVYLFQRKEAYDWAAKSLMTVATLFGSLVMVSGPLWAKPIWGVYWTWDPRLTTSFVIFVLLLAYLVTRKVFEQKEGSEQKGAVIGAILAVIAVLDIPLIHFSVRLWRGVHPNVLRDPEGLPEIYRNALEMMIIGIFLFGFLLAFLLFRTYQLEAKTKELETKALAAQMKRGEQT